MAIDPTIALSGRPVQPVAGPLDVATQVSALANAQALMEDRRAQAQQRIQAVQDDAAQQQALMESKGDPDEAIKTLMVANPRAAVSLQKVVDTHRDSVQKTLDQQYKNQVAAHGIASNLISAATPDNWSALRPAILATFQDPNERAQMDQIIPQQYDPGAVQKLVGLSDGAKSALEQQGKA